MVKWTEDQRDLRDGLAQWFTALNDGHLERDKNAVFDGDKWKIIRESGILSLPFEEQWGGLGQDLLTTMYVLEGLGHGSRDGGLSFSVTTHMVSTGVPLQRFGSADLKARYLPGVCDGTTIGAHAISEPDSGSDALKMRTTARREGDRWILSGSKTFVSNAPVADLFVVYARTHPDGGPLGITAFLVERDTPGLTVGKPIDKMGLKTSPIAELFFDECAVPAANVIGRPGAGFLVLDHVMKWEILCSFIVNVGEMQHRLERCVDYAKQRTQFGKPIGSFQSIANKIVDMKIGVENARRWLYETASRLMNNENVTVDVAISKLLASEANLSSALAAVQIFGGNGYMAEFGLERDLRNAVGGTIYSGTTDIQRNRVAAMMGL
ncbi:MULTISPECIES: acyl-CoA dehydrogenase family protein [Streptosporangium]|uniref:Alkylation response protein AidB-like acyl-CoA dehydrogenase n=1 Tax=Streptosporangium brasiliense TaxID=47480 RepID=A0ABT9RCR7_9ACTN|nr:acyl-CoA dehydrogenase family protein [Streptosporangium brasiliense]MDP9867042.1 alkylation response protein AidB-like acyl-CoA dehydrogenase [Streptosporangium brasiliense]